MRTRLPQIYRLGILAGILVLLHLQGKKLDRIAAARPVEIAEVAGLFPDQKSLKLGEPDGSTTPVTIPVLNAEGAKIGSVSQTSPIADSIKGYVGPTNVLLGFDPEGKNVGAVIRSSADTTDHLRRIEKEADFFTPYRGQLGPEIPDLEDLDAVTGATLTSLAIRDSISLAYGGQAKSLKFPDTITLREAGQLIPEAVAMRPASNGLPALEALNADQEVLGLLLRTGAAADTLLGYRGPTEALIALDPTGATILSIRMRGSYDTYEYTQDVRTDDSFFNYLKTSSVADWTAAKDPGDLGVEGISGATLTSYAMAEGIHETLQSFSEAKAKQNRSWYSTLTGTDALLGGFVLTALLLALTRLRKVRWFVRLFQIATIVYLGFIGGHMLAQTLFAGWTRHGIPWAGAAGLVALLAAAFVIPAITGRNVYCQYLCPHGAAQQLLMGIRWKGKQPWRIKIPTKLGRILGMIPTVLLVIVVLALLLGKGLNLAALEPFDAYLFPAAGIATLVVALTGLAASFFHPMAYCKFGCPTGQLLEFTRFRRAKEVFGIKELTATALLMVAAAIFFFK